MFCNVIETLHVSHADFKRFVMFCKRLSSDSAAHDYSGARLIRMANCSSITHNTVYYLFITS